MGNTGAAGALPEGPVTFLFTDLEGSTRLLQAHPDAYRAAVARHHALLAAAVEAHGGAVFETVGDAVYAAFARPTDAVKAALAGQLALHGADWGATPLRVRMGVHLGEVERQGAHYFGAPLYRCARLMAAAHGGQTVLSEAAAALVRDAPPVEAGLLDLGQHRLKDLQRPERVFQLTHPGLPAAFPPLRSLDALPTNLPVQPTPLVGREALLGAVRGRLLDPAVRLLTLTGPGGVGKTRLALQAAADLLDEAGAEGPPFPDGVWFVPLAAVRDPALVPAAVAQALGVKEAAGQPLAAALADFLRPKRLLLVLDNFEQVVAAAPAVGELLAAAPGMTALVTSRTVLRLSGEHDLAVPPLALPALPDPRSPEAAAGLSQYEAVRLFIERARAARAGFAVTNATAPAVAEICHRLDGLPLALELAAARVRLLPPEALLARLGRRLPLLTGGARDRPERQQTLRAAIAWSHDLLSAEEGTLFRRLAVFAGGFSLEAAEAICAGPGASAAPAAGDGPEAPATGDGLEVLDALGALVDGSLVEALEPAEPAAGAGGAGGEARYRLLETVREYAAERLEASGEADAVGERHAAHYLALAQQAGPELRGGKSAAWLARLEREHDNFRGALRWALDRGRPETALRLGVALAMFWYTRGHLSEGWRWLEAALAQGAAAPPALRASALSSLGILAWERGEFARAARWYEEALALHRELGNRTGVARALGNLAWVAIYEGDLDRAAPLCAESLALFRALGDRLGTAIALNRLGSLARHRGQLAQAQARYEESLALRRALGDRRGVAVLQCNLGATAVAQGDYPRARALLAESLAAARALGDREGTAANLEEVAAVAAAEGRPARAARLLGAAAAVREALGAPLPPVDRAAHERSVAAARAGLGDAAFAAAWAAGQALPPEQAVAEALEEAPVATP